MKGFVICKTLDGRDERLVEAMPLVDSDIILQDSQGQTSAPRSDRSIDA